MSDVYGVPIPDLPDGYIALDALVLVKAITPDGDIRYLESRSQALTPVEALGMLVTGGDTFRANLIAGTRQRYEGE
jgi:hypothetical protein